VLRKPNHPLSGQPNLSNFSGKLQLMTITLLICSVVLNVMLAKKTSRLSNTLLSVKSEHSLAAGVVLPPIEAKDLDDHPQVVGYNPGNLPTLLYVFTPPCAWCAKNVSNLKTLAEGTRGRYRLIGLSLSSDNLREYVSKNGLEFPIYKDLSPQVVVSYRLGGTPQTILVSDEGKLLREWKGAYVGNTKKEIEEYFGVKLPGINDVEPN
jgi:peroxiredoxin